MTRPFAMSRSSMGVSLSFSLAVQPPGQLIPDLTRMLGRVPHRQHIVLRLIVRMRLCPLYGVCIGTATGSVASVYRRSLEGCATAGAVCPARAVVVCPGPSPPRLGIGVERDRIQRGDHLLAL